MPGWLKHKLESKLPEEISITSDMQMTPSLWQKVKMTHPTGLALTSVAAQWKKPDRKIYKSKVLLERFFLDLGWDQEGTQGCDVL